MTALVAEVGPPETSRNHPADVLTRLEQHHVRPFPCGGNRGDHPGSRGAVDDYVIASQPGIDCRVFGAHRRRTPSVAMPPESASERRSLSCTGGAVDRIRRRRPGVSLG